jgi:hypothetical protein
LIETNNKKIAFCQATFKDDFAGTKKCIERIGRYVDFIIIVEDGSLTIEQKEWLKKFAREHGMEFEHEVDK